MNEHGILSQDAGPDYSIADVPTSVLLELVAGDTGGGGTAERESIAEARAELARRNATVERDREIAQTILEQLGWRHFRVMMGVRTVPVAINNGVTIRIGHGARDGINCFRVVLMPSDTYTVIFYHIGRASIKTVATYAEVYGDALLPLVEHVTGMRGRL